MNSLEVSALPIHFLKKGILICYIGLFNASRARKFST